MYAPSHYKYHLGIHITPGLGPLFTKKKKIEGRWAKSAVAGEAFFKTAGTYSLTNSVQGLFVSLENECHHCMVE